MHVHAPPTRTEQRRALSFAVAVNGALLVAQVAGGIAFNSLALLADAAHMGSDVAALAIALVAQRLMERPASARHSFGLKRAEVLGALFNGLLLVVVGGGLVVEALRRLWSPPEVSGTGLVLVATAGLAGNVVSAVVIARRAGHSLNMRAAVIHMTMDAVGSAGAIVAGVAVVLWDAHWADPLVSIAIATLVLVSTWGLLRDTVHVLLEGAPRGMDPEAVERAIAEDPSVEGVHHLHMWAIASDLPALSAHVVLGGNVSLHEAQGHGDRLRAMLAERYGVEHVTLELECHSCEPARDTVGDVVAGEMRESERR